MYKQVAKGALVLSCLWALPSHADSGIYAKAGFLGAGVGYMHDLNPAFRLRGDITTIGNFSRDGSAGSFDFKGKLRNNQATIYADWFPIQDTGLHFSAGLALRDTNVKASARPNDKGSITIGDTTIAYGANDSIDAKVSFPAFAPYLGVGWAHAPSSTSKGGWGFMADLGVTVGKPTTSFDVSDSVRNKLIAAGVDPQSEIDKQKAEIHDKAKKLRLFPSLYVGVSYSF